MADYPDQPVSRRIENACKGHGQFDDAEADPRWPPVTATAADGFLTHPRRGRQAGERQGRRRSAGCSPGPAAGGSAARASRLARGRGVVETGAKVFAHSFSTSARSTKRRRGIQLERDRLTSTRETSPPLGRGSWTGRGRWRAAKPRR